MSLTKVTYAMIQGAPINVLDFGAVGDGSTDDTAAIQAAIDYAKSFSATYTEIGIEWPSGNYCVTSLDYLACERVTNIANGSVIITGTQSGGTAILSCNGASSTNTRNLNFQGNFVVEMGVGSSYQYGVYINGLIGSSWEMAVSGAFSVNTVYINYSWDNPQLNFTASNSSGTAIATILCDQNNVNRNHFNCRVTGSSNMAIASVGFELAGNANVVEGDFSSCQTGIFIRAARGATIISPYMEGVKYGITTFGSKGNTIVGGLFEVGTNGAAFNLDSSQNTTILSPRIFGTAGGSGRTAFALGTGCYGLTVTQPDLDPTTIDNNYTGTWRGHGGFTDTFPVITTQWVSFPPTQVPSTDANTLDDYAERDYTPSFVGLTVVGSATYTGKITKIGRVVYYTAVITPAGGSTVASAGGGTVYINSIGGYAVQTGYKGTLSVADGSITSLGNGVLTETSNAVVASLPSWSATASAIFISGFFFATL